MASHLPTIPEPSEPPTSPPATTTIAGAEAIAYSEDALDVVAERMEFSRDQAWRDSLAGVKVKGLKWTFRAGIAILGAVSLTIVVGIALVLAFMAFLGYHYIAPEWAWLWSEEQRAANVGVIKGGWGTIKDWLPGVLTAAFLLTVGPKVGAIFRKFLVTPPIEELDGNPKG